MEGSKWCKKITFIALSFWLGVFVFAQNVQANWKINLEKHVAPKTAAFYLNTAPHEKIFAHELAKWDLVILDMQAQNVSREMILRLRELRPDIILLAYSSAIEYPKYRVSGIEPNADGLWTKLGAGFHEDWVLKRVDGSEVSFWPGNIALHLGRKNSNGESYANYLANFLKTEVMDTGLWDGLIFDTVWNDVSWNGLDIDIDGDGKTDTREEIDQGWYAGHQEFFKKLRSLLGSQYMIVGNGVGEYHDQINGRMFEGFPEFWEGGWRGSMEHYYRVIQKGYDPRIVIVNSDTENTGNQSDYRMMRFGLASTLLSDGYYNFDFGTTDRSKLWRYDEYNAFLGAPKTEPFNINSDAINMAKNGPQFFGEGVWRRDYEKGIVLINSSKETKNIDLEGEFERLRGSQDSRVNNGKIETDLFLGAEDGLVLLRPLSEITDAVFRNGAFVRVFNASGEVVRNGFFAYENRFAGNSKVVKANLFGNASKETVVAEGSKVKVYNSNGSFHCEVSPYGNRFRQGVNLTVGDLEGDGNMEIITGTENGGGPHVRIFNRDCRLINPGFFAYGKGFRGGVHVEVGDLNNDGILEIVVGAGVGGGPHIRIFNKDGRLVSAGFFAYPNWQRDGVDITLGDVNGDRRLDIITRSDDSSNPVKVFNSRGLEISSGFKVSAGNHELVNSKDIIAVDLNQDGTDEILVGNIGVFGSSF